MSEVFAFGENPDPLHSVRLTEISAHPIGWAEEDVPAALGHARVTGEFAQVCREHPGAPGFGESDNQGEGGTLGLVSPVPGTFIRRYVPRDEWDAEMGGPCGRCGRRCPASVLSPVEGKRLCPHCARLRQPIRPMPGGLEWL